MQRWCGFAKDNGDIKVPAEFEIRDIVDDNDTTHYEAVGVVVHVGKSFKSGHYFSQIKIGMLNSSDYEKSEYRAIIVKNDHF